MLSIELIRRDPDLVRQALESRGEQDPLAGLLDLDAQRRQAVAQGDELRAQRNQVSRQLGQDRAAGREPPPDATARRCARSATGIAELEQQVKGLDEQLNQLLLSLPNIPLAEVPKGVDESHNVILREWGEPPVRDFEPLPHWDLGERLGLIDFEKGVKLSGSRFYTMFGAGAKLERGPHLLDVGPAHSGARLHRGNGPRGGQTGDDGRIGQPGPKFVDNLYHDEEDDLWLVPTAEVPITNLYRDDILAPGTLPLKYVAQTPCFRREKAAAGRDTRGIKRVHQFNKVEMYKLVEPETSGEELERLVADAEDVCKRLELPYRVIQLCTGDMGFASGHDLRYRGLVRGLRGMAGSQLLLQLHRLPGPPVSSEVSPLARRTPATAAHSERLRAGLATGGDRYIGELSAGRWLGNNPPGPPPLYRIRRDSRT